MNQQWLTFEKSHITQIFRHSFEKIKEFKVPSLVHSASLHPAHSVFVCGGEDFKMYKMDYETGHELESFKGAMD